jgi:hypothetical protein
MLPLTSTLALELAIVLDSGLQHSVVDLKPATVIYLKHAASAIDLKPIVIDVATVYLPGASPFRFVNY